MAFHLVSFINVVVFEALKSLFYMAHFADWFQLGVTVSPSPAAKEDPFIDSLIKNVVGDFERFFFFKLQCRIIAEVA